MSARQVPVWAALTPNKVVPAYPTTQGKLVFLSALVMTYELVHIETIVEPTITVHTTKQ
jgi:hypothetical protein